MTLVALVGDGRTLRLFGNNVSVCDVLSIDSHDAEWCGSTTSAQFAKYPASTAHFTLPLVLPRLRTPEERRFRSVLRSGIRKGYNVVEGGTENERVGPNFAGHFVLVQWGCGLNCMEAAVIDSLDGTVLQLPRLPKRTLPPTLELATGSADMRTLKFRTDSRLLGIPIRSDGMIYHYTLEAHAWRYVGKVKDPEVAFRLH